MRYDIDFLIELTSKNKLIFEHKGMITGRPFYRYKHLTIFYATGDDDTRTVCINDTRKSGSYGNTFLKGAEPYRIFMEYHNSPAQKLKRLLDETE